MLNKIKLPSQLLIAGFVFILVLWSVSFAQSKSDDEDLTNEDLFYLILLTQSSTMTFGPLVEIATH